MLRDLVQHVKETAETKTFERIEMQQLRKKAKMRERRGAACHAAAAVGFDCSFILFIIAKLMINVPQSAHVLKYSSIEGPLICEGGKPINSDVSSSHAIFI